MLSGLARSGYAIVHLKENMSITDKEQLILHEMAFTKRQLMQLSKPELELLLRLGLAVNELMLFQRFVGLITNSRPQADAAQDIWLAQLVTALMCSTGKV